MDEERRERLIRCRIVERWTTCRRYGDPAMRDAALRAFRGRWSGFMEGGWEALCAADPGAVEAARRRAAALLPQHPQSVSVAELLARIVDEEAAASEEHLLAALLMMERHGHVDLRAGWASRPAPRVPRRGHAFEDLFLLLGYGPARETCDGAG